MNNISRYGLIIAAALLILIYVPTFIWMNGRFDEAKARADKALDMDRDEAAEGWSEEVTQICWGEVRGRVVETERRPVTPEDNLDCDEVVDYALQDTANNTVETLPLANERAKGIVTDDPDIEVYVVQPLQTVSGVVVVDVVDIK